MPITPTTEIVGYEEHQTTPIKSRIQGTIDFLESQGIKGKKEDVFRFNNVSHSTGYRLLSFSNPRRLHNDPTKPETRGRKSIVTREQIETMEHLLETEGLEARGLTWEQLGLEAGCEASGKTIQRVMGSMDYRKCVACRKGWVNRRTAEKREDFARIMLERYPSPHDWKTVRFSDEVHFGWGPQGRLLIVRKPGQRYCSDCIQHQDSPSPKDEKRFHCWAAVGYNFKSPLVFYDIPGNSNGKMTLKGYIEHILEPVVKPWLIDGQDFVLEEDGDSGYGTGAKNIVRTWKEEHSLRSYFNAPASPDLSPIENCWLPPKQHMKKYPHWDDVTTKELINEGWDLVTQDFINEKVLSMPARLQQVIDLEGKMTGF